MGGEKVIKSGVRKVWNKLGWLVREHLGRGLIYSIPTSQLSKSNVNYMYTTSSAGLIKLTYFKSFIITADVIVGKLRRGHGHHSILLAMDEESRKTDLMNALVDLANRVHQCTYPAKFHETVID